MRRLLLLVAVLALSGCPKRTTSAEADPAAEALARADAAWEARGQGGFDPVSSALDEAYQVAPTEPSVLWRLARLYTARGEASDDDRDAMKQYGTARSLGLRCLNLEAGALQREAGQSDLAEALRSVGPTKAPCLAWGTFAWARWYVLMGGDAASVDLDTLDVLVGRAKELAGAEGVDPGLVDWTEGLLAATRPDARGRDLDEAEARLRAAVRARPEDLVRRADLVAWVAVPKGDAALVAEQKDAVSQRTPSRPEEIEAAKRIEAAQAP